MHKFTFSFNLNIGDPQITEMKRIVTKNQNITPTFPLTTTSSVCNCLHLSQASSYCIDRKLKTKLSSASFSPIITNSSRTPGTIPASSTCFILCIQASWRGKYAEDFAVISTKAPLLSVQNTVPFTWDKGRRKWFCFYRVI